MKSQAGMRKRGAAREDEESSGNEGGGGAREDVEPSGNEKKMGRCGGDFKKDY